MKFTATDILLLDFIVFQTALSPPGFTVKSIIDPTTCINMHHHFCLGFVSDTKTRKKNHAVDPNVAVVQHYKKCHRKPDVCRQMKQTSRSDDTILKYRTELIRAVSEKLANIYKYVDQSQHLDR